MKTLNNPQEIQKLDKSGMASLIACLPRQFFEAEKEAREKISAYGGSAEGGKPLEEFRKVKKIVICGMGGSGIAGEITKSLIEDQIKIPFEVIHDWHLPENVGKNTLVIGLSFSGKTAETLNCLAEAEKKQAKTFLIQKKESQMPPRAGLGYLLMSLLVLLEKLNLINLENLKIKESLKKIEEFNKNFLPEIETEKNSAKLLAYACFEHLPYIIAPEKYKAIAKRFKTQINENAKSFAVFETLPEASHHTIESQFPETLKDQVAFLLIEDNSLDEESQKTIEIFKKWLAENNFKFETISPLPGALFTRLLSLILTADWLSFYLSMLYQIDPTPVEKKKKFKDAY